MATLLDAFNKATKHTNVFEEYIEFRTKYLTSLKCGSYAMLEDIRETSPFTQEQYKSFEEMSMILTSHFSDKAKDLKKQLLELVKDRLLTKLQEKYLNQVV